MALPPATAISTYHGFRTRAGAAFLAHDLEQVVERMSTGWAYGYSHVLGAALDSGGRPGLEATSTQGYSTLVMPCTLDGVTAYAPALGAAE